MTWWYLSGLLMDTCGLMRNDCEPCMIKSKMGKQITKTLVYHTFFECTNITGTREYNHTRYQVCNTKGKITYFDPQGVKYHKIIKIWVYSNNKQQGHLLGTNWTTSRFKKIQICFDACKAIEKGVGTKCGFLSWRQSYRSEKKICKLCSKMK